eukprot:scaffold1878_cov170-Amphora_coffeaeformis.AAC.8
MKQVGRFFVVLVPVTIEVIWQTALLSQFRHQIWDAKINGSSSQLVSNLTLDLFQSPLVLVAGQCDGGSEVLAILHAMVQAHGFDTVGGFDLLTDGIDPRSDNFIKNEFYYDALKEQNLTTDGGLHREALVGSLHKAQAAARALHRIFFFQADPASIQEFQQELNAMGVWYASLLRENALDRCICQVRKCIVDETYGYPVFANNGTNTDLCSRRKQELDAVTIQAKLIDTKGCIESNLRQFNQRHEQEPDSSTSIESLFVFQTSTKYDKFQQSADAWMALLKPLLRDHLETNLVLKVLEQYRGIRHRNNQKTAVYNFDFVRQHLEGTNNEKYLRP